jgi:hypothetical protein
LGYLMKNVMLPFAACGRCCICCRPVMGLMLSAYTSK